MSEIVHKELSYQVVAALFDAFKALGASYHEKYCQKAVEKFLIKRNIPYKKEYPVKITIEGDLIGRHYLDFLIDDLIVLELKKGNDVRISDVKQVLMYLKTTNLQLGILAYFGSNGVRYKRIINSHFSREIGDNS